VAVVVVVMVVVVVVVVAAAAQHKVAPVHKCKKLTKLAYFILHVENICEMWNRYRFEEVYLHM